MEQNSFPNVENTLDYIPPDPSSGLRITALVKDSGTVVGYQLSDNSIRSKSDTINLARSGGIAGVGISHRGSTEYLKTLPDQSEGNNLSNLPTITDPNNQL